MLKVDKVSLDCQKSSISNQKLSFATLKTLCSLHEPIISFVSQQLHYKRAQLKKWLMPGHNFFYYYHFRTVCSEKIAELRDTVLYNWQTDRKSLRRILLITWIGKVTEFGWTSHYWTLMTIEKVKLWNMPLFWIK